MLEVVAAPKAGGKWAKLICVMVNVSATPGTRFKFEHFDTSNFSDASGLVGSGFLIYRRYLHR